MKNVDAIIQYAEQHCKAHGARLTIKRKQILAGLIQSNKALSAYELMDVCKERYGENIPAMSVYRILEFLEDEYLVHKLNLANKYVACSHITCDHAHGAPQFLICGTCSKVKEISMSQSTITELQETVRNAGYQLMSPQLEMNCLCDNCSAQAAQRT
ncbi:MAG: transcriptional repressor [Gammaproteobacteria bacterium]